MKLLIAEDDQVSRRLLEVTLERMGYEILSTANGQEAWEVLRTPDSPQMAILDWMMPQMDGVEVCRHVREDPSRNYIYLILLTARGQKSDVITGLDAGADDYLTKPFDPAELAARLDTERRILALQADLAGKIDELQDALTHVRQLQGLLPICMHCKKIRDDEDSWHRLETYIERHSEAMFTHSLCSDCKARHYPKYARVAEKA